MYLILGQSQGGCFSREKTRGIEILRTLEITILRRISILRILRILLILRSLETPHYLMIL